MHTPDLSKPAILFATLGSEAQVVTAALDLLRAQGVKLQEAWAVHTSAPGTPVAAAVRRLEKAFEGPPYQGVVRLRLLPIVFSKSQL